MFCTRDVLQFGSRTAIDKALWRMVKNHELERLTSGLFVRNQYRGRQSLEEIVRTKAEAFKRQVWTHGSEAAFELGLSDAPPNPAARHFSTDGPSSRFQVGAVTVFLHHVSMRKVQYLDSPVGKTILAFWFAGESGSTAEMFASAIANFTREQLMILRKAIAIMPQWLTERIPAKQRWQEPIEPSITEKLFSEADPYDEFDPAELDSLDYDSELALSESDGARSSSDPAGSASDLDLNSS